MEKDNPLVSICMPAYNAGKYISEAINSVLEQSYKNIELIIVNDGSIDETKSLLDNLKDSGIKIIHTENRGQCAAANLAFQNSSGGYIKFMDADDMISPDFIKNQVERIDYRDDLIASASWGRFFSDDISTFKIDDSNIIIADCKPIEWLVKSMQQKQVMLQCALWLIPRKILLKSGIWDESLSLINDFEFYIRVLLNAKTIKYTENAILYHRSGMRNSLSASKSLKSVKSAYDSINLGTSYLIAFENSERVKHIAADCFQNFVFTFYPHFNEFILLAEQKIKELGGSTNKIPEGGYTKVLNTLFGWKMSKRIKLKIGKL